MLDIDQLCVGLRISSSELMEDVTYDVMTPQNSCFRGIYEGVIEDRLVFSRLRNGKRYLCSVDATSTFYEMPNPFDEEGRYVVDIDGVSEEEEDAYPEIFGQEE